MNRFLELDDLTDLSVLSILDQFVAGDTYEEAFMTALQWEQEFKEMMQ